MKIHTLLHGAALVVALVSIPLAQGCYVRASGPAVRSPAVVLRPAPRPRTVVVRPAPRPRATTVVVQPPRPATVVIRPR